jgi:hypothetical protein
MLRFFGLLVVVMFLSAMLVIAARQVGAVRPSPLASLFSNPDGSPCQLPCLFGIRPGETRADEALAILDSHPLARQLDVYRQHGPIRERQPRLAAPTIAIEVTPDSLIDTVVLTADGPYSVGPSTAVSNQTLALVTASIGDAFSLTGEPPAELTSGGWASYRRVNHLWLKWPDRAFFILSQVPLPADGAERLSVGNPIWVIEVFAMSDCPRYVGLGSDWRPWLGFTTKQRYDRSQDISSAMHIRTVESGFYAVPCRPTQAIGSP